VPPFVFSLSSLNEGEEWTEGIEGGWRRKKKYVRRHLAKSNNTKRVFIHVRKHSKKQHASR
jgi:hypothetical protein